MFVPSPHSVEELSWRKRTSKTSFTLQLQKSRCDLTKVNFVPEGIKDMFLFCFQTGGAIVQPDAVLISFGMLDTQKTLSEP